jgi:CubicO group peptidase (beta-lactamase class C family)
MELLFNSNKNTPASDTFKYLAATEPTSGFGEVFQYNNLMASAAGYIAGHIVYPKLELGTAFDKAMQTRIFDPLGMNDTTLDMDTMLKRNHASPHDYTLDGKTAVGAIQGNYTFQPFRPAGGAWSSAHDMIRYVQNELAQGLLPNGKRMVSALNLLERRKHGVPVGKASYYGMGLQTDATWGVEVVQHGGSLFGYKSDILMIPEAQIGAVILTNSDQGQLMLSPFKRRLLEVLYDGRPEAMARIKAAVLQAKGSYASERKRTMVPPDPIQVAKLARVYQSKDLGELTLIKKGKTLTIDTGLWKSSVGTRPNDDGTTSLVSLDPTLLGFEWVIGERDGRAALITRDSQHDYVFLAK